jgi:hypothetical protein
MQRNPRFVVLACSCLLLLLLLQDDANGFSVSPPRPVRTQRSRVGGETTREHAAAVVGLSASSAFFVPSSSSSSYPLRRRYTAVPHPPKTPPSWEQINANAASCSSSSSSIPSWGTTSSSTAEQLIWTALVGGLSGGIAVVPVSFVHYFPYIAQCLGTLEHATVEAVLFALVYRQVVGMRNDDDETNQQDQATSIRSQSVVGTFVAIRTFFNLHVVTAACTAFPEQCKYEYEHSSSTIQSTACIRLTQ